MSDFKRGNLVVLKESYRTEIEEKANFFSSDKKQRPLVISLEDETNKNLKWAIPLTTKSHLSDKKIHQIESMLSSKSIVANYYEPVKIFGKDYYAKVRDIKPISEDYIDHIFTINNQPVAIKNQAKLLNLENKVKKVLSISSRSPEKFEQKLADTKMLIIRHIEKLSAEEKERNEEKPGNLQRENDFEIKMEVGLTLLDNLLAFKGYLKILANNIQIQQVAHCRSVDTTDLKLDGSVQNIPRHEHYLKAFNAQRMKAVYYDICEDEIDISVDLAKDPIISCVWKIASIDNCIKGIGSDTEAASNGIKNEFTYQKNSHIVYHIYPLGINLVHTGNHSIFTGIIKQEGTVKVTTIIDISKILDNYVYTREGLQIRDNEMSCNNIIDFCEIGVIYELAKKRCKKGEGYILPEVEEYINSKHDYRVL